VGALTLMLVEGTDLYNEYKKGQFHLLAPEETLKELYWLIESMECKTMFRSNHASNYVPLGGDLPQDKSRLLQEIRTALRTGNLKSEYLRGL
jgi:radical SAM superfamily enzyme